MSLVIADKLFTGQGTPVATGAIYTYPVASWSFLSVSGIFRETMAPWPAGVLNSDGSFSFTLPWPSEFDPATAEFLIIMPNGNIWQGMVPEGIPGPLSIRDLKNTYDWHASDLDQLPANVLKTIEGTGAGTDKFLLSVANTSIPYNWLGNWNSTTAYNVRDVVFYQGSSYIAVAANTNAPPGSNPADWNLFASGGGVSVTGQGFNFRGAWVANTAYHPYDVVTYNGSSYLSTTTFTSGAFFTASNWSILAQAGSNGNTTTVQAGAGGAPLTGAVQFVGAGGTVITQSGQIITVTAGGFSSPLTTPGDVLYEYPSPNTSVDLGHGYASSAYTNDPGGVWAGLGAIDAFDSDPTGSGWQSTARGAGPWAMVDMGTPKTIMEFRMRQGGNWTDQVLVQGSPDGTTFTTVATVTTPHDTNYVTADFYPATYRYWRIFVSAMNSGWGTYITDINLYGPSTTTGVPARLGLGTGFLHANPTFGVVEWKQPALSDLGQSGAISGQVPSWNGTAWVPTSVVSGGNINYISTTNYTPTIVADTPSLFFRMNETSGTVMADSSGNGRNGTYSGSYSLNQATLIADAQPSVGFTSFGASYGSSTGLPLGNAARSVEVWFKSASGGGICDWGLTSSGVGNECGLVVAATNQVSFYGWSNDHTFTLAKNVLDNTPHYLAMTFDGSTMRIYVDGVLQDTWATTLNTAFNGSMIIGSRSNDYAAMHFNGTMADLAIYTVALSSAQVLQHYNAGAPTAANTFIQQYRYNSATVLYFTGTGSVVSSGELIGTDFAPSLVTGTSAAARYFAATTSGHPTTGTWKLGDIVPDLTGALWICTTAGSPGTWTAIGGGITSVQAANTIYAGPVSGANALPTFRSLVTGDLPLSPIVTKSAAYSVVAADKYTTFLTTAAGVVFSLPAPASVGTGFEITIKNSNQTTTSVKTNAAGVLIDGVDCSTTGATTGLTTAYGAVTYETNGTNWYTIAMDGGGTSYTLPIASASALGGIKIGTGLSVDGTGVVSTSGGGAVIQGGASTKVQLNYVAASDLATALAISATTWTTIGSAQSFTVDDAASVMEMDVSGVILNGPNTIGGVRILVDSTPYMIGGWENDTTGGFANALSGVSPVPLTLTAGSHTVAVQIYTTTSSTAYCRPATKPNQEPLSIRVLERKTTMNTSAAPVSGARLHQATGQSIPNNAWTVLTFDTVDYDTDSLKGTGSSPYSSLAVTKAGKYQLESRTGWSALAGGGTAGCRIKVNGVVVAADASGFTAATNAFRAASTEYDLKVGDVLTTEAFQNGGGAATTLISGTDQYTVFSAISLGGIVSGTAQSKVQLVYPQVTDISFTVPNITWTNILSTVQSFTVDDANSVVEVQVAASALLGPTANGSRTRLVIDGNTTTTYPLGGKYGITGEYVNPFDGAAPVYLSGLAAGVHTAQLQVFVESSTPTFSVRAATRANYESLVLTVIERKLVPASPSFANVNKVQLAYVATTDLASNLAVSANTWTDIGTNQSFTVDDPNSLVEMVLNAGILAINQTGNQELSTEFLVDGTTEKIIDSTEAGATVRGMFPGSGSVFLSGLAAGAHTVKVRVRSNTATQAYCDPATSGPTRFLNITVIERKVVNTGTGGTLDTVRVTHSSPPAIPATTETALLFDTNDTAYTSNAAMHSMSSNTSRLVAQAPGRYRVWGNLSLPGNSGTSYLYIRKNGSGSNQSGYGATLTPNPSGTSQQLNVSGELYLNATDYVELVAFCVGLTPTGQVFGMDRVDGYAINPATALNDMIRATTGGAPERVASTGVQGSLWSTDATGKPGWNGHLTASALLSADVSMPSSNVWYDSTSIILAPGSWVIVSQITLQPGLEDVTARLWDGTTTYASGGAARNSGGASGQQTVTLIAFVSPTSTTSYKTSAASDGTTCKIKAATQNNAVGNNASSIYAMKFAG